MDTMRSGVVLFVVSMLIAACDAKDGQREDGTTDTGGEVPFDYVGDCTEGQTICMGNMYYECVDGVWGSPVDCHESGQVCNDDFGCVLCHPGRYYCDDQLSMLCDDTGMNGTLNEDCSLEPGSWCDMASGLCIDECGQAALDKSNIGCEYWAVDLDNAENAFGDDAAAAQFAVAIANVDELYTADVWVYWDQNGYGEPVNETLVPDGFASVDPGEIHIFRLPRYDVDGPAPDGSYTNNYDDGPQSCFSKRSFRIESSIPVVAYQFNTLDQQFSNDASLLLPTSGLGDLYHVVSFPPNIPVPQPAMGIPNPNRCYVTIVATEENTHVWVTPSDVVAPSLTEAPPGFGLIAELPAGVEQEFLMNRYEVLNLENKARLTPLPDLTGTIVRSSAPVAVFTGVDLAILGDEAPPGCDDCSCCAEHLEMQVIPKVAMGKTFVVTRSPLRSSGGYEEPDYYRVLAVRPDTHVTTNLPDVGSFTLGENEMMEFKAKSGFVLESSPWPVHLVQILTTQERTTSWTGDPTMVPFPAVEERRPFYVFTTGEGFSENWAVISIPDGASATIDGADVASSCGSPRTDGTVGSMTYYSYYCPIADGHHVVDGGDDDVGVTVYGYYGAGSYGYPAGSDLHEIFLE